MRAPASAVSPRRVSLPGKGIGWTSVALLLLYLLGVYSQFRYGA